jgi:hypothetical protein
MASIACATSRRANFHREGPSLSGWHRVGIRRASCQRCRGGREFELAAHDNISCSLRRNPTLSRWRFDRIVWTVEGGVDGFMRPVLTGRVKCVYTLRVKPGSVWPRCSASAVIVHRRRGVAVPAARESVHPLPPVHVGLLERGQPCRDQPLLLRRTKQPPNVGRPGSRRGSQPSGAGERRQHGSRSGRRTSGRGESRRETSSTVDAGQRHDRGPTPSWSQAGN